MEENKNKKRKKRNKFTYSLALVPLVVAFFAAEKKNGELEDLPRADFGRVPERLLLSVRTKAIAVLGD